MVWLSCCGEVKCYPLISIADNLINMQKEEKERESGWNEAVATNNALRIQGSAACTIQVAKVGKMEIIQFMLFAVRCKNARNAFSRFPSWLSRRS